MKKRSAKSALAFIKRSDATYDERAAAMSAGERAEIIKVVSERFKELNAIVDRERELTAEVSMVPIAGVNTVREIGRQIELFTQHDKLKLAQFNSLAVALPDASLNFAKECLSTFRKFTGPVTTSEEAQDSWRRIKVQLDLIPKQGHGRQQRHPEETIMDFLGVVIRTTAEAMDVQKKMPMETWPDFQRNTFERESQPIHDLNEKAKAIRLLKEKGE